MMPTCCDPENQRVRERSRVPAHFQPLTRPSEDDPRSDQKHAGTREAPRTRWFSGSDTHFEELSSWTKNERVCERSRVPARFHGLTGS